MLLILIGYLDPRLLQEVGDLGILGAIGVMLGGISFTLNRFIGPGRLGFQSSTSTRRSNSGRGQQQFRLT